MNFKFSPSKNEFEYREYINYRTVNTVVNKIYISCVKLLGYILVFINMFKLFNKYKFASNITTAILLLFLGITAIVILICLLGKKIGMKKYKKQFVDSDTIYSFKMDECTIYRENKHSYIEAPLKSITEIIKIDSGLIIKLKDISEDIFIPIKSLPIEEKEFIHYIEDKNSDLEVKEYKSSSKKKLFKLCLEGYGLLIIAIILGLAL
ncbi:hypothetical protein [Clostridium paraputrificum]|uniref:hypothetical protein n=1 Tax=Clostridium paraputrificum TaxID=29363 RepID=UPI000666A168|nr:hypothetical protein [Clostridium paraputrificum]